jgi:hypothetical protein
MIGYLKRGMGWFVACTSAMVLAFVLAPAGIARAGNFVITAEGGTTDNDGSPGDAGHVAVGGLITLKADNIAKSLDITISYEDSNFDAFVCNLITPSDFCLSGGTATLTVSASDPKCFQMGDPVDTFSNAGNSITLKGVTIGNRTRFVVTSSTLVDFDDDVVDNVAIAGEVEPSGAGSNQAGGNRLIIASGGAVDFDDSGHTGHMALAGAIALQPIRKNEAHAEAKALDLRIEYQDFFETQHMSCHLTTPSDVSYSLDKGVGQITFTVSASDSCTNNGHSNTGKSITFTLYAAGAKGRIVSTDSTLVNDDGETIGNVAVVGEISTGSD